MDEPREKMSRWFQRCLLLLCVFAAPVARGHIGSPNVIYEGLAGPYHIRVIVRPPGVIPGLADINVRVLAGEPSKVFVLPVRSDIGKSLAPAPDLAKPVKGELNLYAAQLWLMTSGAYNIVVNLEGTAGEGRTVVPVNSIATTRLNMPKWMGGMLLAIAAALFLALVTLVGAAVRESGLPPGEAPGRRQRIRAIVAMGVGAVVMSLALYGGRAWWNKVDANYRNNKMYKADPLLAAFQTNGTSTTLRVELGEAKSGRRFLVPDHGKLIHLFMVKQGDMSSFAHLHPVTMKANRKFESVLPSLPAGRYSLYADLTQESGFTQTLTTDLELPNEAPPPGSLTDPDDSWLLLSAAGTMNTNVALPGDKMMTWERAAALDDGKEMLLRFRVRGADGKPAVLEPYLGMQGHAVLRNEDGSVFTHLHPFGTISMASQQLFVKREQAASPNRKSLEVVCGAPPVDDAITFPYEFPKPGRYRIWVQVKSNAEILTGCFDAVVGQSGTKG
ncbi:MAG TPA: hypothetical protein VMZ27_05285 [Candidatus Saccharimonadales bacterium]|nr:hypothetical protein [Candidatus Saccharimonadales bacterium]